MAARRRRTSASSGVASAGGLAAIAAMTARTPASRSASRLVKIGWSRLPGQKASMMAWHISRPASATSAAACRADWRAANLSGDSPSLGAASAGTDDTVRSWRSSVPAGMSTRATSPRPRPSTSIASTSSATCSSSSPRGPSRTGHAAIALKVPRTPQTAQPSRGQLPASAATAPRRAAAAATLSMSELRRRPGADLFRDDDEPETDVQVIQPLTEKQRKLVKQLREEESKASGIDLSVVLWILASVWVVHTFDVVDAVLYDTRINRTWMKAGLALMAGAFAIALYCLVWLATIRKVPDYERHAPWAVPASSVLGILGWIVLTITVWPLWGFLTLLVVPVVSMGALLTVVTISPLFG
eukprot:m.105085 g.105085  ORF g.105085 m.105085 type:complete len:357 (+) comp9130_c0_seq2:1015-2085(+)